MVRSASPGSPPRLLPEPAQADHLAVGDALRDDDVDLAAGPGRRRASSPRSAMSSRVTVERRRDVLAPRSRRLAGRAGRARRKASPKSCEKMSSPPPARAPAAAAGAGAEAEAEAPKSPSWPPPGRPVEAFEALEARLAVGVDLAAVELGALAGVAEDLVGRVQLGEAVLRLRVGRRCGRDDGSWRACGRPS